MGKKADQARSMICIPGGGKYGRLISKLKQGDGFTLIEMLLTVAIIAVLVAISIPMVSGRLERVRVTTDAANERVARSAAMTEYLMEGTFGTQPCVDGQAVLAYYDAAAGKWRDNNSDIVGYGKCITTHGHEGQCLWGLLWQNNANGELEVYLRWDSAGGGAGGGGSVDPGGDGLVGLGEDGLVEPGEDDPSEPSGDDLPGSGGVLEAELCGGCKKHDSRSMLPLRETEGDGSGSKYTICPDCRYFEEPSSGGG